MKSTPHEKAQIFLKKRELQNLENSGILRGFSIGDKTHKNGKRLRVIFLCFSTSNRKRSKMPPFMSFASSLKRVGCSSSGFKSLTLRKRKERRNGSFA
jgi:hypothetical protein